MGSHQFFKTQTLHKCSSDSSSLSSEMQRGCSKSHNSLLNILRIISAVPPPQENSPSLSPDFENDVKSGCKGFAIDLNSGFSVPSEIDGEPAFPVNGDHVSEQTIGGKKRLLEAECGGECDKREADEIDCSGVKANRNEEIIERGKAQDEQGFMGLLIEAATLIFGDFNDSKFECKGGKKSLQSEDNDEVVVFSTKQVKQRKEDALYPVVRSKRGRIQVLPNKYKDSILEPLTPFPRIRSTIFANNRRRSSK